MPRVRPRGRQGARVGGAARQFVRQVERRGRPRQARRRQAVAGLLQGGRRALQTGAQRRPGLLGGRQGVHHRKRRARGAGFAAHSNPRAPHGVGREDLHAVRGVAPARRPPGHAQHPASRAEMREDRRRVRSTRPRSGAQKGAAVEVHHPSRGGREGRRGRGRGAGIRRERGRGVDDGGASESGGASGVGRRRFGSAGCWRRFGSAGCSRAPPEPDQGCEDTRGPDAEDSDDGTVEPHAGVHGGRARVVSTGGRVRARVVSTGGRVGDDDVDRSRRGASG